MKKIFIVGINGKMGKMLCETAPDYGFEVSGGFDMQAGGSYRVFTDVRDVDVPYDAVIDFSRPSPTALDAVIYLAKKAGTPAIIATTGYDDTGLKKIDELSQAVPVFKTSNFSLGIAAAKAAALAAQAILGDKFDIEIVEKHHNQKADSPSGTAILLADALAPKSKQVVNRVGKRSDGELGIVSIRGGGVVGEHEIGFYGDDEIVTVSHSARSRRLFAAGALKATLFVLGKRPGMYDMDDLVDSLTNGRK